RDEPVGQRWLGEVRLLGMEARDPPIAAVHHLERDIDVTPLVGLGERTRSLEGEGEERQHTEEQRRAPGPRGEATPRAVAPPRPAPERFRRMRKTGDGPRAASSSVPPCASTRERAMT